MVHSPQLPVVLNVGWLVRLEICWENYHRGSYHQKLFSSTVSIVLCRQLCWLQIILVSDLCVFHFLFLPYWNGQDCTIMLSKKGEREHICFLPDLRGKAFSFTTECKCQLQGLFVCLFFVDVHFFLSFLKIYILIWLCQVLIAACGIQFLDQGSNPGPQHWEHGVLHWATREVPRCFFFKLRKFLFIPIFSKSFQKS